MIQSLAFILLMQLIGEVIARAAGLNMPGPVIGMVLFVVVMMVFPRLADHVRGTATALLAHLSLLFVPAGVGVVGHIKTLGSDVGPIAIVIFASTVVSIIVGVFAFIVTARLLGQTDD